MGTIQETKEKSKAAIIKLEDEMLAKHEGGKTLEELATRYGFTDRRAVHYHIKRARARRTPAPAQS